MLDEARAVGLRQIEVTTTPDNIASHTVIERNGGDRAGTWLHPAVTSTWTLDRYVSSLDLRPH